MNDITPIPLNKLIISEDNVRTTVTPEGITELAASLMAHGQKQNLVVRKKGKQFAIIDGKRQFMAHMVNIEAGRISANFPVPCLIDETSIDGNEISLITNTLREDLHPADEFEAFKARVCGTKGLEIELRGIMTRHWRSERPRTPTLPEED